MNDFVRKKIIAEKFFSSVLRNTKETRQAGIYLYIRTDEQGITWFYVGQAVNVFNRQISHYNGFMRIDKSLHKRGLKTADNPNGWEFTVLQYCDKEQLNELEQKYLTEYMKKGYQTYNVTGGGQFGDKKDMREYKEPKGYRQGLVNGYKKAQKDIAKLFDKNLTYSINGKPNKNKEKALNKFTEFLKID